MEEPKIMQVGSYSPLSCAIRGRNPDNPSDRTAGINTEQRLEVGTDVANCLTTVQKDSMVIEPLISVHPLSHTLEFKGAESIKEISPALRATDYKCPHCVYEPCGCYDNQFGEFAREPLEGVARTLKADHHNAVVLSRKDDIVFKEMPDGNIHAYRASDPKKSIAPEWQITNADNIHPTITTSHEPKVLLKYRIRKLTEREVYRLQDVDDADIDKLFAYRIKTTLKNGTVKEKPIPKSRHYALAGNSITVSPLYFIFKAMFIDEPPKAEPKQLSLFD